jgi:hypothetical protein
LLHEPVTEGDVEVQRSLAESFWQTPVMGVEKVIVEFEADSEYRVGSFVVANSHFEQCLAEIPT